MPSGLRASGSSPPSGLRASGSSPNTQCRYCRDGWEHCHGTVIFHAQRRPECTEDDCVHPESVAHTLRIDCESVGCTCAQLTALAV